MGDGVFVSDLNSGETGNSPSPFSGEKSARSSKVKTGGGGGSNPPKFSLHSADTAAAWPGVTNFPRWAEIGDAKSR